jgi:hypothetical protein
MLSHSLSLTPFRLDIGKWQKGKTLIVVLIVLKLMPLDVIRSFLCATSDRGGLPEFQELNGKLATSQNFFVTTGNWVAI